MIDSSECCAGSHQGEPWRYGFYSCIDGTEKTYLESGIKASMNGFARRSAASKKWATRRDGTAIAPLLL
jgi:hypothetical protein